MPELRISEKNHWRDRIAARIGKAIERIKAQHPALFDRVKRQAHAQSLESLGLTDAYAELEAIKAEQAALTRREKRAQRAMLAALRGVPIEEVADGYQMKYGIELPLPSEAAEAITRRQAAHSEQLLADDPVWQQITRLEAEREGLLDTIWLATSPSQIRALWSKVTELLGDEPTPLEREALAIEPVQGV
jgi:hypothetical protein